MGSGEKAHFSLTRPGLHSIGFENGLSLLLVPTCIEGVFSG